MIGEHLHRSNIGMDYFRYPSKNKGTTESSFQTKYYGDILSIFFLSLSEILVTVEDCIFYISIKFVD